MIVSVGCSSQSNDDNNFPRSLNNSEAQIFSRALFNNFEQKYVNFYAEPFANDIQYKISGIIDWENAIALVNVIDPSTDEIVLESIITKENTFERFDTLEGLLSADGKKPGSWIQRPTSTDFYRSDTIGIFLLDFYTENPENPQLLRQDDSKIVGKGEINNEEVFVFEKSGNINYFINENSEIKRIQLKLKGYSEPVGIDFSNYGKRALSLPNESEIYDITEVSEIFASNRPDF